jgi:hypothetical protein
MDEHRKHEDKAARRAADRLAEELHEHVQIVRANCSAGTLTLFKHDPSAPSERSRLEELRRTTGLDAGARARLLALSEGPDPNEIGKQAAEFKKRKQIYDARVRSGLVPPAEIEAAMAAGAEGWRQLVMKWGNPLLELPDPRIGRGGARLAERKPGQWTFSSGAELAAALPGAPVRRDLAAWKKAGGGAA